VNALPPLKVVQLLGNACLSPTTLALKDPNLLSILGGKTAMTESPLIREIVGDRFHKVILKLLVRAALPFATIVSSSRHPGPD
jgi:hypothetical protein